MTAQIHTALAAVMAEVRSIGKDGRNQQQNFNFRGIDGTLNAIGPALRNHGVIPMPELISHTSETVEVGKNKTAMRSVTLVVKYTFVGPDGSTLAAIVPGEAMDSGDKAFSKAMSVAMRTALLQTFAMPTQEKDPDEDEYERASGDHGSQAGRGAPPQQQVPVDVTQAQARVWTLAQQLGWGMDRLTREYAETASGQIMRATAAQLDAYGEHLRQEITEKNQAGQTQQGVAA